MSCSLESVRLTEIDSGETAFRISTEQNLSGLAASIASVGLLATPILRRSDASRYTIVSGFRRVAACRSLNRQVVPARILSEDTPELDCAGIAITENAFQRPLNLIERSRALRILSAHFSDATALSKAAAAFGLAETPATIDAVLPLCGLSDGLQAGILNGTISLSMARELMRFDPEARAALAELLLSMKMSLSKQREVLTMLREISLKEGAAIPSLLSESETATILSDPEGDRNTKAERLRRHLKQRRYPAIHAAEEKTHALIRSLKLREEMKLVPPENLEGTAFTLTLRFHDVSELRGLHHSMGDLLDRPELERLISKAFLEEPGRTR